MPAQMDEIINLAAQNEIPVIEDAAEAVGLMYYNRACSSFGDLGKLSYKGNKIITTPVVGELLSNTKTGSKSSAFGPPVKRPVTTFSK